MEEELHDGKEVLGASVGESKGEAGAGGLDQLKGAAVAQAGGRCRGRQFDEARRGHTSSPSWTSARKPTLEVIVAELQSRCSSTQPMDARQLGGGTPELVGNALPRDAGGPPSFQALGQRVELRGFDAGSGRCRCHSSPPTLAGTGGGVTHAYRSGATLQAWLTAAPTLARSPPT